MKLPNWFKILWWIILLFFTGAFLFNRRTALLDGNSTTFDIFVFLIFVALMLVPIFAEVELFGIKLKQEIEELKDRIDIRFGDLKNEIKNSQVQTVHNTFQGFGPPPPDEKLPELEKEIEKMVKTKLAEHGLAPSDKHDHLNVPSGNLQMFKVRYNIETEIRRIWERRFSGQDLFQRTTHRPIIKMISDLATHEIINDNFHEILREILAICNYAIHGEKMTENQNSFIQNNAVGVIDYLRQIK